MVLQMIDTSHIDEKESEFTDALQNLRKQYAEKEPADEKNWQRTVGALLLKDNKILLVKRGHQPFRETWTLPGGHINEGEQDTAAIIREVTEETGITFTPTYFGSYEESFEHLDYYAHVSIFHGPFTGEPTLKKVDVEEILDIQWYSLPELTDLKIGFEHRKIIEEYFTTQ